MKNIERLQIIQGTAEEVTPKLNEFLGSHPNAKILSSAVCVKVTHKLIEATAAVITAAEEKTPTTIAIDISDAAKTLAEKNNIDLTTITGTGSKGTITKADIQNAIENPPGVEGVAGEQGPEAAAGVVETPAVEEIEEEVFAFHAYTVAVVHG